MAQRKVRRVKKRKTKKESEQNAETRPETSTQKGSSTTSATRQSNSDEEVLRGEYAYVIDDLRKMAVIAAGMFILLIVLGLVL